MNKFLVFILVFLFLVSYEIPAHCVLYKNRNDYSIFYKNNSPEWHNRNDHLIPTEQELEAILLLKQDRDLLSKDIDKDGINDNVDPSMYDWREIGYQPFGVLEFLSWRHDWNSFKYSEDDLKKVV